MNKDQIYQLIGRPHFREGLYGVREWDYLFNYREDGELKTCQYKTVRIKTKTHNHSTGCLKVAVLKNLSLYVK